LALGEAGKMVKNTIGLYLFSTVCAVCIGILSSLAFSSNYVLHDNEEKAPMTAEVRLVCSVDDVGSPSAFLTEMNDGSIVCAAGTPTSQASFLMDDVNGYFASSAPIAITENSLSESLYHGLFMQLIEPNMLGLFIDNNFLGVIILGVSIFFGYIVSQS